MIPSIKYAILISCIIVFSDIRAQYTFDLKETLTCTSVKNQKKTNTCWSFATNSFIESELIRQGYAEYDISEMYIVRMVYLDKARNYLNKQGKANFVEGSLSHDVIRTIANSGMITERAYPGIEQMEATHNHGELVIVLKAILDGLIKRSTISDKWPEIIESVLDVYLGPVPETFLVHGRTVTPEAFAREMGVSGQNYLSITSFSHHPFYEQFILEIPDNYSNGLYYNVKLDDLVEITDYALSKGYTVAWDGDVSEKGFNAPKGIAVLPVNPQRKDLFTRPGEEVIVDGQTRQLQFETYKTTDDHLMHITGLAYDQNGTKYYLMKNSWGIVGPNEGFLYMSEAYFKMKTMALMVHWDALPSTIARKIKF